MRGPGIPSDTICSELIATIDLLQLLHPFLNPLYDHEKLME